MLIEFRVSNFRSIKDEQVLSLVATKDKSHLDTHTVETGIKAAPRLVKSAAIYGPNASGKSNLVHALGFMQAMVRDSASLGGDTKYDLLQPFRLDAAKLAEPTTFEVVFMIDGVRHNYGFSMTQEKIMEEWLYVYATPKPQLWFSRSQDAKSGESTWKFGESLRGEKHVWAKATRSSSLYLSMATLLNSEYLGKIYRWITENMYILRTEIPIQIAIEIIAKRGIKDALLHYLNTADIGISDVLVEYRKVFRQSFSFKPGQAGSPEAQNVEQVEVPEMKFRHKGENCEVDFGIGEESDGTRKMVQYFPVITEVLEKGGIMVVDELERSLHPLLMKAIIGIFHNREVNSKSAQLVFTTHNTSLLDKHVFRRDQIWFTEKDASFTTSLTPLSDFSPRKNEAFESGYLTGRYGAIPFLDDLSMGG